MNKTVHDLKGEIGSKKEKPNRDKLQMKNLETQHESQSKSCYQDAKDGRENHRQWRHKKRKWIHQGKGDVKSKNILPQNIQEFWNAVKRQTLRIIGIDERKEIQAQGRENILKRITKENILTLKKEIPIKV